MNLINRLRSTEVSSRTAVIAALAVVLVTAGGATLIVRALTEPAVEPLVLTTPTSEASPATTRAATSGLPEQGDSLLIGQAYDLIVQRGLFQPSPVALAPEAPLPALIEFDLPEPLWAQAPPESAPLVYCTGIVEIAAQAYALLENGEPGIGEYAPVGGMALGYRVLEIAADYVVVESGGETSALSIRNNKPDAEHSAEQAAEGESPTAASPEGATPVRPTPQNMEDVRRMMQERPGTEGPSREGQRMPRRQREG